VLERSAGVARSKAGVPESTLEASREQRSPSDTDTAGQLICDRRGTGRGQPGREKGEGAGEKGREKRTRGGETAGIHTTAASDLQGREYLGAPLGQILAMTK